MHMTGLHFHHEASIASNDLGGNLCFLKASLINRRTAIFIDLNTNVTTDMCNEIRQGYKERIVHERGKTTEQTGKGKHVARDSGQTCKSVTLNTKQREKNCKRLTLKDVKAHEIRR